MYNSRSLHFVPTFFFRALTALASPESQDNPDGLMGGSCLLSEQKLRLGSNGAVF